MASHPAPPYFPSSQRPDSPSTSLSEVVASSFLLVRSSSSRLFSDKAPLLPSLANMPTCSELIFSITRSAGSQPSSRRDRAALLRPPVCPLHPADFPPSIVPLVTSSVPLGSAALKLSLLIGRPSASDVEPGLAAIPMDPTTSDAQPLPSSAHWLLLKFMFRLCCHLFPTLMVGSGLLVGKAV